VAIAATVVGYITSVLDVHQTPLEVCATVILTIWLSTVLNWGGANLTSKIANVTVWGAIIPVFVLIVIGWFWFSPHLYVAEWNPAHLPFFTAITRSITITLWAFLGFESAAVNMGQARNPQHDVPIAVLGATLICAVFNIAATAVVAGIVPGTTLAASNAPFGLAFATMFSPVVGKVAALLMGLACFGCLLGWQFTFGETMRSSAIEGYFPRLFTRVNRAGVPVAGMAVCAALQSVMALSTISPTLQAQFTLLVDLSTACNLVPYVICMAALDLIQRTASQPVPIRARHWTNAVGVVAGGYSLYAIYTSGVLAGFGALLMTGIAWMIYGFMVHKFPERATV
jgi:putrescine:ornithine antiporter